MVFHGKRRSCQSEEAGLVQKLLPTGLLLTGLLLLKNANRLAPGSLRVVGSFSQDKQSLSVRDSMPLECLGQWYDDVEF
jgi:hypothetical protein